MITYVLKGFIENLEDAGMTNQPLLIVIADDEPTIREGLASYHWDRLGYQVAGKAKNGEEALRLVQTLHPDVLLTDIKMPFMDGIELIKKVRESNCDCKIILLSGYKDFEYARSAIQYGVSNYLLKPFEFDEFESVMINIRDTLNKDRYPSNEKNTMHMDTHNLSYSIREAINYISKEFGNKITLDTVSNYVHLNASYFSTLFKQETKMNFVDYLKKYRMEEAKKLLVTSDMKVFEIAVQIGIKNPNYFTEVFKEYTGLSPLEFRKKT